MSNVMGVALFAWGANPPVHVIDAAVPAGIAPPATRGITTAILFAFGVMRTDATPSPAHVVVLIQIAVDAVIVIDTRESTGVPVTMTPESNERAPVPAAPVTVRVQSFAPSTPPRVDPLMTILSATPSPVALVEL